MEKFSLEKDKNIFEEKLKYSIAKAYQTAMNLDNYDQKIIELRNLRQERINGLSKEKEIKFQQLSKEIADSEVVAYGIIEYKKILELLGLSKEKVSELLNHENAHANVTEQVSSQTFDGFRVRFHKDSNGKITFTPSIKTTTDMSFPEKQRLEEDILINEAPIYYGDKLSERDKTVTEEAKRRLSQFFNVDLFD